jgi:hypothetical protein
MFYRYYVAKGEQADHLRKQYKVSADRVPVVVAGQENGRYFNLIVAVDLTLSKEEQEKVIEGRVQEWVETILTP